MDYRDYYKILGLNKNASQEEIKKQYRKLAVKYHPDKNKGNRETEDRFKEISEAYQVLGNPENRKKYDKLGANWKQYEQAGFDDFNGFGSSGGRGKQGRYTQGQQDFSDFIGGAGFSDFFEAFFGGSRPGTGSHRPGFGDPQDLYGFDFQSPGNDLAGALTISLYNAFHGTERVVDLSGEKIRVRIKPGAYDGLKLRIKGKGEKGRFGKAGDLYLTIRIENNTSFSRVGDDLLIDKNIDVFTAMLGGASDILTIDGKKLNIKIPEGTPSGKKLRLKGKGMPVYGKPGQYGDLLISINIKIPEKLNAEQKILTRQLRDSLYHPA